MICRRHLVVMAALIAVDFVGTAAIYRQLPDPCPTHWNLEGQPDAFGPPWKLAFLVPAVAAGVMVLLTVLPILGPFRQNFERFRITYGRMCTLVVAVIVAFHAVFMADALGRHIAMSRIMAIICGAMFMVMGNWLGKVRRNFYLGIRTPWTLVNERVWEKTHRAGGKLMVCIGIASVGLGLFADERLCAIGFFSGLGLLVAWSLIYSFVAYRRLGHVDDVEGTRFGE